MTNIIYALRELCYTMVKGNASDIVGVAGPKTWKAEDYDGVVEAYIAKQWRLP